MCADRLSDTEKADVGGLDSRQLKRKSIIGKLAYRQVKYTVLTALVLGIVLTSLQVYLDFNQQLNVFDKQVHKIIDTVQASANHAAFLLDSSEAKNVADGIMHSLIIIGVEISANTGEKLVSLSQPPLQYQYEWLANFLFGHTKLYHIPLTAPGQVDRVIGEMTVVADPHSMTEGFFNRAITSLIAGLIKSLLLAATLSLLFFFFLTKPLLAMIKVISTIDPTKPDILAIAAPHGHEDDELSELTGATSSLLKSINNNLAQLTDSNQRLEERVTSRTHKLSLEIAERKQAEQVAQSSLALLQKIAHQVPGVVYQYRLRPDGHASFPFASEGIRTIYRVSPEEVREDATKAFERIHPDDLAGTANSIEKSAQELTLWHHEHRVKFDDNTVRWLLGSAKPEQEEDGSVLWHGFITDITKRKREEEELRVAATVFESQEGMMVTDTNSIILRVNHAFTKITGYSAEEAVGKTPQLLSSGKQDKAFCATMWASINNTGTWEGEIWDKRKSGEVYPQYLTVTAVKDDAGIVANYVATLTDITMRKAASEALKALAFYDPLTQLPNRRLLIDRLSQAMTASKRNSCYGALVFLDLDNFKSLNDTHGHVMGDSLLIEVANRLKRCVRETDTVVRLGGDEFVLMLSELSSDKRESISQTRIVVEKVLATLSAPYLLSVNPDGQSTSTVEHHCTASIGVAMFVGHAASQDDILKWADAAMCEAKHGGRNQIRFSEAKD